MLRAALILLVLAWPSVGGATALSDKASSLKAGQGLNSWGQLTGVGGLSLLNDCGNQGTNLPFAEGLEWNPLEGAAYYFGSDDPINCTDDPATTTIDESKSYHLQYLEQTNTWLRLPTGPYAASPYLHQYDGSAIDWRNGVYYYMGCCGGQLRQYDLETGVWSSRGDSVPAFDCCSGIEYFPERQAVYLFTPGTPGVLRYLADGGTTWQSVSVPAGCDAVYHAYIEYNPVKKGIIFGGGNGTKTVCWLGETGSVAVKASYPGASSLRNPSVEITTDPVSGDFLVLAGVGQSTPEWYQYDVTTNIWTNLGASNVPTDLFAQATFAGDWPAPLAVPIPQWGVTMWVVCQPPASSGGPYRACTQWLYKHTDMRPHIPSVADETATYQRLDRNIASAIDPDYTAADNPAFAVGTPDTHYDAENDELQNMEIMWQRTGGQAGYGDRRDKWLTYFMTDFVNGTTDFGPTTGDGTRPWDCRTSGSDWLADHTFGWGLVTVYERTGTAAYLDKVVDIVKCVAAHIWGPQETITPGGSDSASRMSYYGARARARQLLLLSRLAEHRPNDVVSTNNGTHTVAESRERLIDAFLQSSDWNATDGMYYASAFTTDSVVICNPGKYNCASGAHAAGYRIQPTLMISVLSEAFWQAYRAPGSGNPSLAARLVAIADWCDQYCLDSTYQMASDFIGREPDGTPWQKKTSYPASGTPTWDPSYTTNLTNTFMAAYKMTRDIAYFNRAVQVFTRGTNGIYGQQTTVTCSSMPCTGRYADDTTIYKYQGTFWEPGLVHDPQGQDWLAFNKGDIPHTYMLFENGGSGSGVTPDPDTLPPSDPTNLVATANGTAITLTWTASTDAGGGAVLHYEIQRAPSDCSGSPSFAALTTDTASPYLNSGLPELSPFAYRIRAVDNASPANISGWSACATATTGSAPPPGGPWGAYDTDEGSGTSLTDYSGNAYTGTLTGGWGVGKYGGAVDLTSVTSHMILINAALPICGAPFDYNGWFYLRDLGGLSNGRLWHCGTFSTRIKIHQNTSNRLSIVINRDGSNASLTTNNNTIPLNEWVFIGAAFDPAGTLEAYAGTDCAAIAVLPTNGTGGVAPVLGSGNVSAASLTTMRVGNNPPPNNEGVNGVIDNPRMYSYVRTATQRQQDCLQDITPDPFRGAPGGRLPGPVHLRVLGR